MVSDRSSPGELVGLALQVPMRPCAAPPNAVHREAAVIGRTMVVFGDREIVWEKPSREYLPQGRSIDGDET